MEPATVTAALAAGHHLTSIVKGIADGLKASAKSEVLAQLIELQSVVLEVMEKQQELLMENGKLRDRVKELEAQKELSGSLKFDGEVYWREDDKGKRVGPFCQTCWDKDGKLARLHRGKNESVKWQCTVCQGYVYRDDNSGMCSGFSG
jgi:hypothetical protein